jgi:hypothetical protein
MRNQIYSALILITLLAPGLTFAQRRAAATPKKATVAACSGAWTGMVTYKRTQSMSDSKREERVSGRGHDTRNWEMKYD